jgi:membrane-associated phospholipid phosphatase
MIPPLIQLQVVRLFRFPCSTARNPCRYRRERFADNRLGVVGTGFQEIMFNRTVCTGDKSAIDDGLEGFPSGHTTAVFSGFVFLSLYLNAKLKIFSNYRPS